MSNWRESFIRLEHNSKRYKGRKEDLDIIFTELKEREKYRKRCLELEEQNFKQDEILRIIKEKEVCVYLLSGCDNVEQYNNSIDLFEMPKKNTHKYHLSKEEFDLLKEVLK